MPLLPQLTLQQRRRKPWPDKLQMNLDDALFAQHAVGFLSVRDSEDAQPLTDQASPLAVDDPTCNHMRKTLQQLPSLWPPPANSRIQWPFLRPRSLAPSEKRKWAWSLVRNKGDGQSEPCGLCLKAEIPGTPQELWRHCVLRGPCVGPHAEQLLAVKLHYRAKARCAAEAALDMEPDPPCWYWPQAASSGYALQPLHRRYAMQHARVSNLMPVCWRLQGWFLRQGLDFGANFVLYRGHPADVSRHCPLVAPPTHCTLHHHSLLNEPASQSGRATAISTSSVRCI